MNDPLLISDDPAKQNDLNILTSAIILNEAMIMTKSIEDKLQNLADTSPCISQPGSPQRSRSVSPKQGEKDTFKNKSQPVSPIRSHPGTPKYGNTKSSKKDSEKRTPQQSRPETPKKSEIETLKSKDLKHDIYKQNLEDANSKLLQMKIQYEESGNPRINQNVESLDKSKVLQKQYQQRENDFVNHRKRKRPSLNNEEKSLKEWDKNIPITSESIKFQNKTCQVEKDGRTLSISPLCKVSEKVTDKRKEDEDKPRGRRTSSTEDIVNAILADESSDDGSEEYLSQKEYREKASESFSSLRKAVDTPIAENRLQRARNSQNRAKDSYNYDSSTNRAKNTGEYNGSKVEKGPLFLSGDDDGSYFQELIHLRQKAASSISNLNRSLMEVKYLDMHNGKDAFNSRQNKTIFDHRKNSVESLAKSIYDELSEDDQEA